MTIIKFERKLKPILQSRASLCKRSENSYFLKGDKIKNKKHKTKLVNSQVICIKISFQIIETNEANPQKSINKDPEN